MVDLRHDQIAVVLGVGSGDGHQLLDYWPQRLRFCLGGREPLVKNHGDRELAQQPLSLRGVASELSPCLALRQITKLREFLSQLRQRSRTEVADGQELFRVDCQNLTDSLDLAAAQRIQHPWRQTEIEEWLVQNLIRNGLAGAARLIALPMSERSKDLRLRHEDARGFRQGVIRFDRAIR